MGQTGASGRLRQRAIDHTVNVRRAHGRLGGNAVEGITLVVPGQADGFKVADLAVQVDQLALRVEFELELLAALELAE
ncbi:hypothetical protein D3C85_1399800 [compost metagenome]